MRKMLCVAILGAVVGFASPAEAHFIPYSKAVHRWYVLNQDRCGAGSTWGCLQEVSVKCPYSLGNHSWHCDFRFREIKVTRPYLGALRTCEIRGQLQHYDMLYRERVCW